MMSGVPFPTAATVPQLVADVNYADTAGGSFTVNLNPGTTFDLATADNFTNGGNGLPVIGGAKAVDLTIVGNGDTIERVGSAYFRLLDVASGSSLKLDGITLQNGSVRGSPFSVSTAGFGGGIYNQGTLTITNSTISGNSAAGNAGYVEGGGIYNTGGTVPIINSILSGNTADWGDGGAICNLGGTVLVSNSRVFGNLVSPPYSGGGGGYGGGIYNDSAGKVTVQNSSAVTGNITNWFGDPVVDDVDNFGTVYQDSTSTIGSIYWNPAIVLDPNAPQIQMQNTSVTEGNTGTVAAGFTVTLSAASTKTITVAYATANGTASAGSDYQAASGTLTFAPGETSKTVTVLVNGDRIGESNETFTVNLSAATNATILNSSAVGTIIDDEPHISITDASKREGNKGQTTLFTFTITLSTAYDQPVTMSYRTVGGTAKSGDDYVAKTGTLSFAPGDTAKTITITVNGDSKKEADETFYLDLLGNSSNSWFTKSRGVGTILNDD
jgi:hypothetical protein